MFRGKPAGSSLLVRAAPKTAPLPKLSTPTVCSRAERKKPVGSHPGQGQQEHKERTQNLEVEIGDRNITFEYSNFVAFGPIGYL